MQIKKCLKSHKCVTTKLSCHYHVLIIQPLLFSLAGNKGLWLTSVPPTLHARSPPSWIVCTALMCWFASQCIFHPPKGHKGGHQIELQQGEGRASHWWWQLACRALPWNKSCSARSGWMRLGKTKPNVCSQPPAQLRLKPVTSQPCGWASDCGKGSYQLSHSRTTNKEKIKR